MTAAITVAQPTPTSRATAATECPSRPTRRHACLRARSLHDARALICGWLSVQVCCSHSGWVQRQIRLTHTNVTGRSPAGRSRTHVGRRPCNLAAAPHTGHQPVDAVVWIAYSISPSRSDTASTAMPSSPSITVALLLSITWGLSFVSVTPRIMRPQARFQTQLVNRVDPPLPRFIEKSLLSPAQCCALKRKDSQRPPSIASRPTTPPATGGGSRLAAARRPTGPSVHAATIYRVPAERLGISPHAPPSRPPLLPRVRPGGCRNR